MNLFYMQDWLAWRLQGFYPERLLRITNKETTSLLNKDNRASREKVSIWFLLAGFVFLAVAGIVYLFR